MDSEPINLQPAVDAVRAFASRYEPVVGPKALETLREISRRLEHLSVLARELMVINDRLLELSGLAVDFDPETDTVTFRAYGEESKLVLNRANPDVPISAGPVSTVGAYAAGADTPDDPEVAVLWIELESKLESFYQGGHKILKLLGTISALPKVRCKPITIVRNHLVEHPVDGALYSFGYGSSGPRVKPMCRGAATWTDEGLIANAKALVSLIQEAISRPLVQP